MAHRYQLENVKYRNWVRAGLGTKYVKEGLEPFCNLLAIQQHADILNKVKQAFYLSEGSCGYCHVETLKPNHHLTRFKQCPLGQIRCNCLRPGLKKPCPNNLCGAIYDEIILLHASTRPNWKNTDARQWCTEPWSIAKCFINAPGYGQETKVSCLALLQVLINNKGFQQHINCTITGDDVFSRVRQSINVILHSGSMELDDIEVESYIDDMIELLEDEKEIKHRKDSKDAVQKLKELKQVDVGISTTEKPAFRPVDMTAINETDDMGNKLKTTADKAKCDTEEESLVITSEFEQIVQKPRKELVMKKGEIRTAATEGTNTPGFFYGRLMNLEENDIKMLRKSYTKLIGRGSLGEVYSTSDDTVPADFGIRIALKKIKIRDKATHKSVRREMIASRILHPFILPLLAVVDRPFGMQEVWFVSPLCENGDLCTAIEKGEMEQHTRVKILLHVALAIQYLHTKVPNVREAILHKDIASRNVVLDAKYNARLIDFGLAREIDDKTATATGRMYYCHPKVGKGENATESWDYYSFGVIIREMLTSLKPEGDENNERKLFLKDMKADDVLKNLSKDIWKYEDGAKVLANTAKVCLEDLNMRRSGFNTNVVEEIKEIWWGALGQKRLLDVPDGHAKCHICMINPKATETSMRKEHAPNCRQKIEACIACEKNNFLNPIRCYCDKDLKPTIGSRCGALLVAGNDENEKMAKALKKDIKELKKVITSRAPLTMGISEDMVRMVVPNTPCTLEEREKLWPEVRKHIEFFSNEAEIDTLLIYFSCHGAKHRDGGDIKSQSNVFELGSPSDSITLDEFKKELDCLGNIDKLIIVLDRCYPPKITMNENRKFIQINASRENQRARITEDGSIFTKYLIQGLKAKSDEKICPSDCKHCTTYWSNRSDFISVTCLFDYVRDHMSKYDDSQPVGDTSLEWRNIAYYTHEKVEIDFTWQQNDQSDKVQKEIPLEFLQTMRQLEEKLCKVFERDMSTTKVKIQKDTFRKRERLQDCDTLEKVMSAWVNRQPLTVKFENS